MRQLIHNQRAKGRKAAKQAEKGRSGESVSGMFPRNSTFDGKKTAELLYAGRQYRREDEYSDAHAAGRALAESMNDVRLEATRDALDQAILTRTQRPRADRPPTLFGEGVNDE